MTLHSLRITKVRGGSRRFAPTPRASRLSFDTPFSNRFLPDRMNGSGTPRFGAPSITESDLCNRREGRAHPRATRHPARRRVQRRRLAIEGRGRQSTGYPAGSRAPALPVALTRPSFGTRRERPARIEADTLVGQRSGRKTRRGSGSLRCPEARLRPAARTVRPSNEPGYLHAARNRDSSPRPFAGSSGAQRKRPFFTRPTP
jgi:hypothetical protein